MDYPDEREGNIFLRPYRITMKHNRNDEVKSLVRQRSMVYGNYESSEVGRRRLKDYASFHRINRLTCRRNK